jgi:MoxR-like ATPase
MHRRFNVAYSDIDALAPAVLRHRIKPNFEAITDGVTTDMIIQELIKEVRRAFNL